MGPSKIYLLVAALLDHFPKESEASNPTGREPKISLEQGFVAQVAKVNLRQVANFFNFV